MSDWSNCKNILVIRPDNMGDLMMSTPAIRALKESFGAKITVLTSSMASGVSKMIPEIDETMVYDLPWVKTKESVSHDAFEKIISQLKSKQFDAAVIFTVYSQNPLPTVMLAYLAGIPKRLAYCRENPYHLLTDWFPDEEPYTQIKHQVNRDLDLVAFVNASTKNKKLSLRVNEHEWFSLNAKLKGLGIDTSKPWLVLHPGVSEIKREYPSGLWIETGKELSKNFQLLFTGVSSEKPLTDKIEKKTGKNSFSLAGELSLNEFILLLKKAPLVISVNTATIHLAAACNTPVIVLYALTNPQHSPWKVPGKVLAFDVPAHLKSKNEVIKYVDELYSSKKTRTVQPGQIVEAVEDILSGNRELIPEMIDA